MEKISPSYTTAFNHGYFLAKHSPNILEVILNSNSRNEYFNGLNEGKRAFELEIRKLKRTKQLQKTHSHKSKDIER